MRKGRIESPWVSLKCLIRIQFLWRKDHIYTRHFSKHTNKLSQLQNKKIWIYLQLLSSQFTSSTEVKLLTWIHRRLEWIILSVRSLTFFWRNHCRDSPCQTSSVVFSKVYMRFFFLTRSLIDRCQIVTDTCKNNVSKFVRKPFKSPLSLCKWKCFGEVSLFNLYHLYFNYPLLAQKLFSLWKVLRYLQPYIIRVLSERISLNFKKIYVIYRLRVSLYGEKLWPRSWKCCSGPTAYK